MKKRKQIWSHRNWSHRNKNLRYILVLAGIIFISALFSHLLESSADSHIQKKAKQIASGTEGNRPSGPGSSIAGESKTATKQPGISAGTENKKEETGSKNKEDTISAQTKKDFDKGRKVYQDNFVTEIKGTKENISAFLNDQEEAFKSAIADYVFSTFGAITVDAVHIKEPVSDSERELTYRIVIEIDKEEFPFICSFHKSMKFYSLYSPSELQ